MAASFIHGPDYADFGGTSYQHQVFADMSNGGLRKVSPIPYSPTDTPFENLPHSEMASTSTTGTDHDVHNNPYAQQVFSDMSNGGLRKVSLKPPIPSTTNTIEILPELETYDECTGDLTTISNEDLTNLSLPLNGSYGINNLDDTLDNLVDPPFILEPLINITTPIESAPVCHAPPKDLSELETLVCPGDVLGLPGTEGLVCPTDEEIAAIDNLFKPTIDTLPGFETLLSPISFDVENSFNSLICDKLIPFPELQNMDLTEACDTYLGLKHGIDMEMLSGSSEEDGSEYTDEVCESSENTGSGSGSDCSGLIDDTLIKESGDVYVSPPLKRRKYRDEEGSHTSPKISKTPPAPPRRSRRIHALVPIRYREVEIDEPLTQNELKAAAALGVTAKEFNDCTLTGSIHSDDDEDSIEADGVTTK